MPRGIYKRKNGKMGKAKKVVQDYANPIQVLADEVVELKKKAASKGKVVTWNSQDPNYMSKDEQIRIENEQIKEHLTHTRRVLVDRVNTIILLLENLKASI